MKRRNFISALAGGVMLGASAKGRAPVRINRRKGSLKKLVVLFQRGGCDGLNEIIPVDSAEYALYQNLRPNVHIPVGNITNIPGNSFFGMHPGLAPLVPIISAGDLSIFHAVGYPNPDRSHFESQAFYETAVPGNGLMGGWLNRYLSNTTGPGLIRGLSIGYNIPQSVSGSIPVPVSANFGEVNIEVDQAMSEAERASFRTAIRDMYDLSPTAGNTSVYETGRRIFDMVDSFANRDLDDYMPENGATYPNSGLGRRVSHAAQMLKDDSSFLGVEVVTIDQGGYDTHANQIPAGNPTDTASGQGRLLLELSQSMSAFYTDMGPARMADTLFLVVTEFGRRAYENDSLGTDHGTGSVAMVMGGSVNGSIFNDGSDWPGLTNLLYDDDLNWVTDYRDIYWEILAQHFGLNSTALNNIIPGHTHTQLGFL